MKKFSPLVFLLITLTAHAQHDRPEDNPPTDSIVNSTRTYSEAERNQRIDRLLNVLREFRIIAYAQVEWQQAQTTGEQSFAGGNFPAQANNRFMIRRARLELLYDHLNAKGNKVVEFCYQFDATERGFTVKDLYGRIYDPWIGWFSIEAGSFKRQFGYETPQLQEFAQSPELARMNQTIFPNDYELGEMVIVESPSTFKSVYLRFDGALVNGDGVGTASETGAYDTKRDFIGRISIGKTFDVGKDAKLGINATGSLYYGGVLQTTKNVYELKKNPAGELVYTNISDSTNINKIYYTREYYGAHLDFTADYPLGKTLLRGEFIAGQQPGTATSSQVPTGVGTATPGQDLYLRQFNGGIFYFVQTFKQRIKSHTLYHDLTFKYDVYTPNTQVPQNKLSSDIDPKVSLADVKFWDYGVGYVFRPYPFFKLMVWYDFVKNADTEVSGYTSSLKDNVLTIRTQFDFDSGWFTK